MSPPQGSVTVAKRSLKHFAVGRIASAIVGIATLLLLVRVLDRADYGLYIALMAGFEIVQLAASPGAYAVVFRYWPELRQARATDQLKRLTNMLATYRLVTVAVVGGLIVVFANPISITLALPDQAMAIRVFAAVFVFESASRLQDAQFESLLQQGTAQASILFRNGSKLCALLVLSSGASHALPLLTWVTAEAATATVGWIASTFLMRRCIQAMSSESGPPVDMSFARIKRFSIPTYASQVIYLCSGADMVKLVLGKLSGAAMMAPFGFAAALASTVQRYLPSFLLVGWLRPLFISSRQAGRSGEEISAMASAVVKLNLLVLAPVATAIAVAGTGIINQLSAGRLPEAESFLYFFVVLLIFQSIRAVIALLGVVFELGSEGLQATVLSLVGLMVGFLLHAWIGVWGFCFGLLVSEFIWAQSMLIALRNCGTHFKLPWLGIIKLTGSAFCAALLTIAAAQILAGVGPQHLGWMLSAFSSAVLCLSISAVTKPFTQPERELINKLIPGRMFVW